MRLSIVENKGDYLTIWIIKDTLSYKLNGYELHQLVIAGVNGMALNFPPGITKEKKKEIIQLVAFTTHRMMCGDRPPTQFIYKTIRKVR